MSTILNESEEQFRLMADASPVLIWKVNADGLPYYYNKTFLNFIGVAKEEAIADWRNIVHPDDLTFTTYTVSTAIAQRKTYSLECRLLRADGNWRWFLAQGNPLFNNNKFLGFVGSSVDITERKAAEAVSKESENRYRNLIEESTIAAAVLEGPDWVLTLANKQMLEIWNKDETVFGEKLLDFMPELREQSFPSLLKKVYQTGETYIGEDALVILNRNHKLEEVYMDFSYKALRNTTGEVYAILMAENNLDRGSCRCVSRNCDSRNLYNG